MENDNTKIKGIIYSTARTLGASFPLAASISHDEWMSKWFEILPAGKKFLDSLTLSDILKDENPT